MIKFVVDREEFEDALKNVLNDIENYSDADVSKVFLKLYLVEGMDYDGTRYENEIAFISTIFFYEKGSVLRERIKRYDITVYEVDRSKGGLEFYDYLETNIFEGTILLSRETIEKMLGFLSKFPPKIENVEILHGKYEDRNYIRCNDELIRIWNIKLCPVCGTAHFLIHFYFFFRNKAEYFLFEFVVIIYIKVRM